MCGIVGFLGGKEIGHTDAVYSLLQRMSKPILSRGPDDFGAWTDSESCGLAHRRLAIVDLSPAGHQPMSCHTGQFVIVFNGEIYNHLELRRQLETAGLAPVWRGRSDTETLLAGFVAWGIHATVERCVGMFAFAAWNKSERLLTLGRDRLGEKPLYYGWQGDGDLACFLFGSDLSTLKAHPSFNAAIDRNSLSLLMRHNYIPAPHSIYSDIFKLLPGHLLNISLSSREYFLQEYWSLPAVAEEGVSQPFIGTDLQAINELELLLSSTIKQQMVADVPLGAFLSGGIDSTTVVALMQAQSVRPIKTFTIGFHEKGYNEAEHAKSIAQHLGTDHTEMYVTSQQALDVIPKLHHLYSEPFSDSSQIPTFLVSQLARKQVTVSLSGDAGDELFCGYGRYSVTDSLWRRMSMIPSMMRGVAGAVIKAVPPNGWNLAASPLRPFLPQTLRDANIGDKLHKASDLLPAKKIDDLYLHLVSHWDTNNLVLGGSQPATYLNGKWLPLAGLNDIQRMMALDSLTYLPDDILVKVDRASMGVSLESRVPFLDHRVVEFAWKLPQHMKFREGVGKWILREVLFRHVPKVLIERPKMGFGVPIGPWLRGPLRDWAEALLDENRLKQEGFFNPEPIRRKWEEHLSGKRNWQHHLWDVLMFQAWLNEQG